MEDIDYIQKKEQKNHLHELETETQTEFFIFFDKFHRSNHKWNNQNNIDLTGTYTTTIDLNSSSNKKKKTKTHRSKPKINQVFGENCAEILTYSQM